MNIITVLTTGQVGKKFSNNNQVYTLERVEGNGRALVDADGFKLELDSHVLDGWQAVTDSLPANVLSALSLAWNRSMPNGGVGVASDQLAPNSARFKRFIEAVTPSMLEVLAGDSDDNDEIPF